MRLTPAIAICAIVAAALTATAPALAASSDYFLKLGPEKPVLSKVEGGEGSAAMKGHQDQIEILSYSFGATRKGWDGTVKGNSASTAKFGAIAGAHRDADIAKPAAKIAPPAAVSHDLRTNVVARTAAPAAPPVMGSITVEGSFPGCTVGTSYADAVLQVPGARYVLTDVQITSCPAPVPAARSRSSMAGEYLRGSLSLNYKKVKVRGWNPETKEE